MKREIQTEHVRRHTLTDQQVKCFKTFGGDGYVAKTGDWITYTEENQYRSGRMLGRVDAPAVPHDTYPCEKIEGYLSVLAISDDLTYAYIRWVKPEDVRTIHKNPPAAFLAFMTGPLPDADMVHKLSHYGTLSQSYIHLVEHHINAWSHGVSPAAWDAGVRESK